jgi:unsaturated rhamnogalacturonyl hydrolase
MGTGGRPGTGGTTTSSGGASTPSETGGSTSGAAGATAAGGSSKTGTGGTASSGGNAGGETSGAGGSAGGSAGTGGAGTSRTTGTGGAGIGGSTEGGRGGTSDTAASAGGASGGAGAANTGGAGARTGGSIGAGGVTAGAGGKSGSTGTGGTAGAGGSAALLPVAGDILALLEKVIPYQIQLGPEDPSWVNKWTEATFYIGVTSAYLATGESEFLTDATNWATKNKWTLLGSPTRNADNQCAGQVYADIYLTNPVAANSSMIANSKTNIDAMVADPRPGISKADGDDWWWCDALFMAPGVVSRLGKITGDAKYYSFLATMWSGTQKGLFDASTGLFWRDSTFVNGTVYWSRGNGWVMGGIVRVLQHLPATDSSRDAYTTLLETMAAAVVPYLQSDGTWHSDLTHPTKYSNPEVSGTGLMTYAIAYGINQGLLDKATYQPVVAKAWKGLTSCVDSQGRVGYIQATGSAPAAATATETHDYGVGAWILAASEIYLMVK